MYDVFIGSGDKAFLFPIQGSEARPTDLDLTWERKNLILVIFI